MTCRLVVVVTVASTALVAGACLPIPPSRSSYGPQITERGVGYRASIGAQSLSADKDDDASIDLGAGWVSEGGRRREAVHGTYIALARRLPAFDGRLWLGGRAETFWRVDAPGEPRHGLVIRAVLRERVGGVSGGVSSGGDAVGAHGSFALGLHAELGARALVGGGEEVFLALGASLDLPFMMGAGSLRPF